MTITRRTFLQTTAAAIAARHLAGQQQSGQRLHIGYAAITWNGKDLQAMDDISAVGFRGIQLRSNIVPEYWRKPEALRAELERRKLKFVALSSGNISVEPSRKRAMIAQHMTNARFLRDAGGAFLQLIDEKPKDRPVKPGDLAHLGELLTEIAHRAAGLGIAVGYHPHMGTMGETAEATDAILTMTDRSVRLLLDVAHWTQGGGNPVEAIRQYRDRLLFVHLKDVAPRTPPNGKGAPYEFVELGKGRVDLTGVLRELFGFDGWAVVELDSVPATRTPKEAALANKAYLERPPFVFDVSR